MLRSLVAVSLRHRGLVLVMATMLALYGVWTAIHAQVDVLPDFAPPQVEVQTEAPGLAPEQVERLVTLPIETALGGLAGLESLRSESIQGLSVVKAIFSDDTDPYRARQVLAENLADVTTRLPLAARPPRISPLTSATMDVLKIGLVSHARSPMELRTLAEWTIRPRLLMVPGVARVNVFGGEVRQIQVQVDPQALQSRSLTLADVTAAAQSAANVRGAGFIDTPNQRVVLESAAFAESAESVARTMVGVPGGAPLRLGDVAHVTETAALQFGDALVQGEPGVLLTLSAAYGANTMEVTRAIEEALAVLQPVFEREDVRVHPRLHRPASFIEASLRNLRGSLLLGGLLVVVVLAAFLRDFRAAAVSLTAIPLSLLAAVIVLHWAGVTLNAMSLGGLALAVGEVVDDAIIDVENILRRMRANEAAGRPQSPLAVTLAASLEVRAAVVYATFAVALVFLPLLALGGLQGRFFAPLALAYLLAVGASLGVALTVTPALTLVIFGERPPPLRDPPLQRAAKAAYRRLITRVIANPGPIATLVVALGVGAINVMPFLGGEFLPDFRESHLVVQAAMVSGTSLDESMRVGRRLSREILALPEVATVSQQAGRAEQGEDTWGPNRSELHVELDPTKGGDGATAAEKIRSVLAEEPGLQSEVLTFLGDRLTETISGETAEVVVSLFADDLTLLESKSGEIAAALRETPGAVDVRVGATSLAPLASIRLRPEALQAYGFRPAEVQAQIETAFAGTTVGQVQRGTEPLDVVVILDAKERTDPERVGSLLVRNAQGAVVPVRRLADVALVNARDKILHEGTRRRQTVTCNVSGRDVQSFVRDAQQRIEQGVSLPGGAYLVFGGTAAARASAFRDLLLHAGIGAIGIVLLLSLVARHPRNLLLLLLNLPLALIGGVLAAGLAYWGSGGSMGLSLGSLVGFLTLFGITTRNAIMLLSHFRRLVEEEGLPWVRETALLGATDRLVPILMTALVTSLGLLPVALSSNRPGGEIDGPMAIVILGGLVTSTLLNLLVLPALCLRFGRFVRAEDL